MATYDEISGWIESQRNALDQLKYRSDERDVQRELSQLKEKEKEIIAYEDRIIKFSENKADEAKDLHQSYRNLKAFTEKKVHCLETVHHISRLEDRCSSLSQTLDLTATQLANSCSHQAETGFKSEVNLSGFIGKGAQDCIFGVRDSWTLISNLLRCVEVHFHNGATYHQFYHEIEESEPWMLEDLHGIINFFETKVVSGDGSEAKTLVTLASELEKIHLTLWQWEAKANRLWEIATKLIPVHLRTTSNKEPYPARSLCDYETKEVSIRRDEDIVLIDNSNPKLWKIKNGKGQEGEVPAPVVLIPGPDEEAIKLAIRFRLQLLANWTNALKVIGKRLIYFMLIVFKPDYTIDEIAALKSMDESEKENLLRVLTFLEDTFKKYWSDHEGFISLQERILVLRLILEDLGPAEVNNEELYKQLLILITTINQATTVYKNSFEEWEKFKAVLEASRSPELMLIVDKWEQLQFVSRDYFSKFWKTNLPLDEQEKSMTSLKSFMLGGVQVKDLVGIGAGAGTGIVERGHDETTRPEITINLEDDLVDETVTKLEGRIPEYESRSAGEESDESKVVSTRVTQVTRTAGEKGESTEEGMDEFGEKADWSKISDEYDTSDFGVAKEKKTAETEQLSSAEMEEKKTFVIRAVINPADQQEISLQQAIMIGVIRPDEGVYVNTTTGETTPIATAMGSGHIKVMFSTTKRTQEKKSSIGIITVKTIREGTRPYIILSVKDTETDKELTQDEATKQGILKEGQGMYYDRKAKKKMLITEAAESGLINIEYFGDMPEPEIVSITYAVRAVVDKRQKKTVTFNEAVKRGIIERDTGAFVDTETGEKMYVGDAIMRGFLKARIIQDATGLDINPENSILIDKTKLIRERLLRPLKVISAFKMAAK